MDMTPAQQPPGNPPSAAPPPPATPLQDPTLAPLLSQSATLRQDLQQLRHDGFTVEWGTPGGGTYYDAPHTRIVIDRNAMGQGADIARSLSHEYGHHSFAEPEDFSSRQAYVTHHLRDEATAVLHNAQLRDEIRAAGGPDIGIAGANAATYAKIAHEENAGLIDRNTALSRIATAFGNEHPSVAPKGDYRDYYGDHYDAQIVPWLRKTGQMPEPAAQAIDQAHPAAPMFSTLRDRFPPEVSDAHVLDAAVRAHGEGLRPEQAQAMVHQDIAWVTSPSAPGLRIRTDFSSPAPPLDAPTALGNAQNAQAVAPAVQQPTGPTR